MSDLSSGVVSFSNFTTDDDMRCYLDGNVIKKEIVLVGACS